MTDPPSRLTDIQRRLFEGEKSAGWDPDNANTFSEEIAHLHEEVSEAFRAFRATKGFAVTFDENGKPQGVPAEFADVTIGMFYIAERFGFDLLDAIEVKHEYNLTRSYAAEGRRLHEPQHNTEAVQDRDASGDVGARGRPLGVCPDEGGDQAAGFRFCGIPLGEPT